MQNFKSFQKDISRVFAKRSRASRFESRKGYLLIELLVALTIFSIVVVIATGSFVNILKTQRQVAALSAAESNLGIIIEEMAREMRTGSSFNCSGTCPNFIIFTDADGHTIRYFLDAIGTLEKSDSSINSGGSQNITGSDVQVQYLNFVVQNNDSGDYPRITIAIGISPNDTTLSGNVLNLETTVSARQPNY